MHSDFRSSRMKLVLTSIVTLTVLIAGYLSFVAVFANPRVERELREQPDSERARKVMLITLPSGKSIPVNYLREGNVVYAGGTNNQDVLDHEPVLRGWDPMNVWTLYRQGKGET